MRLKKYYYTIQQKGNIDRKCNVFYISPLFQISIFVTLTAVSRRSSSQILVSEENSSLFNWTRPLVVK